MHPSTFCDDLCRDEGAGPTSLVLPVVVHAYSYSITYDDWAHGSYCNYPYSHLVANRKTLLSFFGTACNSSVLLGGSWVVISGVISRVAVLITHNGGLIAPLITTHEPPSQVGPPVKTHSCCRRSSPSAMKSWFEVKRGCG